MTISPMTLTIDGGTEILASRANPAYAAGVWVASQALMPRIQIGIGDDAFGTLCVRHRSWSACNI